MVQPNSATNSNPAIEPLTTASSNSGEKSGMKYPWAIFITLAMGMLVFGVAESFGPAAFFLSAKYNFVPFRYAFLGLSLPYIAGGVGSLVAGGLADRIGRRGSFMVSAFMIIIGMVVYEIATTVISESFVVPFLIIAFVLVGFAAIGIEVPVFSMMAESVPAHMRGKSLTVVQNFGNVGVGITFIPLALHLTLSQSDVAVALLFVGPLLALGIAWALVKESVPWNAVKGRTSVNVKQVWKSQDGTLESVKANTGMKTRFLVLFLIGIAQNTAFVFITYTLGYNYFSGNLWYLIPLIGGLFMGIVGVVAGIVFIERVSRKGFVIFSYGSLVVLFLFLWIYIIATGATSGILIIVLVTLLFIPLETTWASRAMLEPELFPTHKRGSYVSFVQFIVWAVPGFIIAGLTYQPYVNLPVLSFRIAGTIVLIIFILGLIATLIWRKMGFETRAKSLSGLDDNMPMVSEAQGAKK